MTGLLGTLSEAWGEVRVHKARVLLSLVGVFLAVLAMTTVTALGQIAAQVQQEQAEASGGRTATIGVSAYDPMTGSVPQQQWDAGVDALVTRYGLPEQAVATLAQENGLYRFPGGTQAVETRRVSPSYGPLHRIQPVEGRWFRDGDRQSLSPALVVNRDFLTLLGVPDLSTRPTVVIGGPQPVLATIVGVLDWNEGFPSAYRIDSSAGDAVTAAGVPGFWSPPTLELWVPSAQADAVVTAVQADLARLLPGAEVQAYRQDPENLEDTIAKLRLAVRAAGLVVLALGGLGVLNIGLVTVRQRIREIGVRRSFGATSARVFSAVVLESVVATALAGLAAVALSVAIVRNLPLERWLAGGVPLVDAPGFPVSAAVEGLVAATAVGALAGLVPALIAVRVKVIDAIRF
ncbi:MULTISPECIES: ABC transporter permease [unclassified Modestobacter]|uniref:ABC transporter permease n=1 Tax=unclassified Modestobacter TaxID=2643866 RepID=UPI0022AA66E2|nr:MULTISPECIES: ABC transporter permease [unclassified Modestobacter]MCZ2827022.1 ABC transporter permease [Modestobacter sp. VKM Ac-2981]MCZ2855282.1 ABC transporter permease [Modestobacter sp. VKM Ac-2982]